MANSNGRSSQEQQTLSGQNMNCNVNMGRNRTDYAPTVETVKGWSLTHLLTLQISVRLMKAWDILGRHDE